MTSHPAMAMIKTWLLCVTLFVILPFQVLQRTMTVYGYVMLILSIAVFCIASLLSSPPTPQRPYQRDVRVDFRYTDIILRAAAVVALIAFSLDIALQGAFDLAASYIDRSARADALLTGSASSSTIWFQLGFLTYPACYALLAREAIFRDRPNLPVLVGLGMMPVLLGTLSMGGRAPLFFAMLVVFLGFRARRILFGARPRRARTNAEKRQQFALYALSAAVLLFATIYFVQVFFIRGNAEQSPESLFANANDNWGIGFNGFGSSVLFNTFGEQYTYLIFIFAWYLVQGLVMSNILFTEYTPPPQLGVYGVDLVAAVARRIDGDRVAEGFGALLQLNTYGFLPSAFGSLYVDLLGFGLIMCAIWGWLTGLVYRNVKLGQDPRWLLIAPFVSLGIFFSLINTPIGFSNGLVTHFWMLVAFLSSTTLVRVRTPAVRVA